MNRVPVSFLGYSPEYIIAGYGSDVSEMGAIPTTRKAHKEMLEEVKGRNAAQGNRVVETLKTRTTPCQFKDLDWVLVDVATLWGDHKKAVKCSRPVQIRKASGTTLELFEKPAGGKSVLISSQYARPYHNRNDWIIAKIPGFTPNT